MKNLLVYGDIQSEQRRIADEYLKAELGEDYDTTPDFFVWDVPYGAGIDDVRGELEHLSYQPMRLNQMVVLILNAERLSALCQGSLLTELESGRLCFVICSRLPLLSTIESRCEIVSVKGNPFTEKHHFLVGADDLPEGESQMLREMENAFSLKDRAYQILKVLHLYKEKDKEAFFSLYKEDCFRVFRVLRLLYSEEFSETTDTKTAKIIRECSLAEAKCLKSLPTANEFNAALFAVLA